MYVECECVYESEHSTNKIIFRFVSSLAVFGSATFSPKIDEKSTQSALNAVSTAKPFFGVSSVIWVFFILKFLSKFQIRKEMKKRCEEKRKEKKINK